MIPWYFITEIVGFSFVLIIFRHMALEVLESGQFWKIVLICSVVGISWDVSATTFDMWTFHGDYVFGTIPFGTPLLEEVLFVVLVVLGISCAWNKINGCLPF